MGGRRGGKGTTPTDLLACFASRAHLTLMPKPICSPVRPSESTKRQHHHHHHHHQSHHSPLSRLNNRGGQASPLARVKTSSEISEPTSPKVTCAGQIKIKQKPSSSKNWESVMEDIERIHNQRNQKKRHSWVGTLGFKKDIMQFLTFSKTLRFNLRCLGCFCGSDMNSDDEVDEEEYEAESNGSGTSSTVFSKWFMVLQENQSYGLTKEEKFEEESDDRDESCDEGSVMVAPSAPPPNALLLMRCRSASAKECMEKKESEEEEAKKTEEEEEKKERLVLMSYDHDFFKVSPDIAKETWVVGGTTDPLSKSRSWKRLG